MKQQECLHNQEEVSEDLAFVEGLPLVGERAPAGEPSVSAQMHGFTAEEAERLLRLKRLVERGERSDAYPLDRRQDFVRWLVSQGKLSDN